MTGVQTCALPISWADPKVEKIERKPDAPLPDLDAAAAPASAPRGNVQ